MRPCWLPLLRAAGIDSASARVVRELPGHRITVRHAGTIIKAFLPCERAAWQRERSALVLLAGRAPWVATLLAAGEAPEIGSWVIMSELPGQPLWAELDTRAVHAELGRLVARLHVLTALKSPEAPAPLVDTVRDLLARTDLDDVLAASALVRLTSLEAAVARDRRVPRCLVHGDWGTSNVLVDREGVAVGIVDWEDAQLGDPVDDLQWMCLHGFTSDELRCAATGYAEVRSLGPLAAERLAVAACRLAAEIAGWPLSETPSYPPAAERQRIQAAARRVLEAVIAGELPQLAS
jgi:aminoglycoside phosphotransferase (APT) family kinase protein